MRDPAAGPLAWRFHCSLLLAALVLWVLNHPLITIDWHDARVYAVLALHRIDPQAFARDPFFMFGSQDDFSLFSPLYAPLIEHFGLRVAHTTVMVVGGALWCVAVLRLSFACMPRIWLAGAAVLALAALSPNYSPNSVTFEINENFATARTLAFPLGVWALAECALGYWRRAALVAFVATLLHPLLGLWPLAVSTLCPLSWRVRWLLIAAGASILAILMLSETGPFVRLSGAWWDTIYLLLDVCVHSPFDKVPVRWYEHGFVLLLLFTVARHLRTQAPSAARLYLLTAIVATSGFLAAIAASWFWPSRLVIQAQLWRSIWMAHVLMPIALAHGVWLLANAVWPSGQLKDRRFWWLLTIVVSLYLLRDAILYVLLAWNAGLLGWHMLKSRFNTLVLKYRMGRLADLGTHPLFPVLPIVLMLTALPGIGLDLSMQGLSTPVSFASAWPHMTGLFLRGGLGIGFFLVAWLCYRFASCSMVLPSGLVILLGLALWHWDMRSDSTKTWEELASLGARGGVRDLIRPGEVVLWGGHHPMRTWYELRTAHYTSATQAIGMVFSQEKASELMARVERIRSAWAYENGEAKWVPKSGEYERFSFETPVGKGIPLVCEDPALDWVVASSKGKTAFPGGKAVDYVDMAGKPVTLYVYRCRDFRSRS